MTYSTTPNATSSGKEPGLFSFLKGGRKAASSRNEESFGTSVTASQPCEGELGFEVGLVWAGCSTLRRSVPCGR